MSDLNKQLAACPFCGGKAEIHRLGEWHELRAEHVNDCHLSGDSAEMCYKDAPAVRERMAFIWNRRAPAAAPAPVAASEDVIAAYRPGTWFDARTIDEMQAFYMSRLPAIRETAKEHGYAIGLHGSARRDFDLLAMPWREGAADRDTLARAIADAACGIRREGTYDWEVKPAGRVATSIPICWTAHDNPDFDGMISAGHIDLSVIDAALAAVPAAAPIVQPVGDLFTQIMNIPCRPRRGEHPSVIAYKAGHRDARHVAAELVAAALQAPVVQAEPVAWRDALRRSGANTDYHGHIAFTPVQWENFVSMLASPTTTAADAKALKAAIAWWKSKRPCSFSKADHVRNPTVNCATPAEMKMALAIAAIATSADEGGKNA